MYKERKKPKNADYGKSIAQRVYISENLTKKTNSCFTCPVMTKEKELARNPSGPTMEEFSLNKLMTVKSLLSDIKKTSKRSKSQERTLEISMDHLHFLTLFENR